MIICSYMFRPIFGENQLIKTGYELCMFSKQRNKLNFIFYQTHLLAVTQISQNDCVQSNAIIIMRISKNVFIF